MATIPVCLIELEHGKYYVTASMDPVKTLEEHREGLGPLWTQIHRPVRLAEVTSQVLVSELNNHVIAYMSLYGMDNVRGGIWEQLRLSDADRQAIRRPSPPQVGGVIPHAGCVIA